MNPTGKLSTRREFLIQAGLLAGSGSALAFLSACGVGGSQPASNSQSSGPITLSLEGWNYDPAFHNDRIQVFEQTHKNITVDFAAEAQAQYVQKLIARFTAGNPPDAFFVHDNELASWADAGYARPIQGLSNWQTATSGLVPFAKNALTYKGKVWGVPYSSDFIVYIYNEKVLSQAQIATPPATWDEVAQQALEIKRAGLMDTPVIFPLSGSSHLHWWSAIFGSGGHLFDADNNPLFPDKDRVALSVLEWLVDAAQSKKILNLGSIQMGTAEGRLAMAAGKAAFISSARYDLKVINDPAKSKIAGSGKVTLFPSLTTSGPHGTAGFTTMYCISSKTKQLDAAWELIQSIGSPDSGKALYLKDGVGYAYKSLDSDKDITAETNKWSDQALSVKQAATAKELEALSASWYPDWVTFNMQQLQAAVLGQKSARQALLDSANKAVQLKKSS